MQLGMIGLGRMGANMVRRLQKGGHQCVVYDRSAESVKQLSAEGATGSTSLDDFAGKLQEPRAIWLMVPAAVVDATLHDLVGKLDKDDVVIDGGNSYYIDDIRRAKELSSKGLHYCDVGTSGGVWGLERGYCQMIGGETAVVKRLDPVFKTLAPGRGDVPRTPGRVSDSGEGRWTILAAIESTAPAPVLSASLYQRFTSRGEDDFAAKVLSAMRFQFGGHIEKKAGH